MGLKISLHTLLPLLVFQKHKWDWFVCLGLCLTPRVVSGPWTWAVACMLISSAKFIPSTGAEKGFASLFDQVKPYSHDTSKTNASFHLTVHFEFTIIHFSIGLGGFERLQIFVQSCSSLLQYKMNKNQGTRLIVLYAWVIGTLVPNVFI